MNERALAEALGPYRAQVDSALRALVERWAAPAPLGEAMAYATLSGGKRVRPAMTLAACEAAGGAPSAAMPYALALELIHTYSLVHDDLPSMDDDDERRGKPTVHVAFDVATAILTGDAILTEAFRVAAADLARRRRRGREAWRVSPKPRGTSAWSAARCVTSEGGRSAETSCA